LALLLFFSPLLTIQVPLGGVNQITGYDVISRVNNVRRDFQSQEPNAQAKDDGYKVPKLPTDHPVEPSKAPPEIPLSIRFAWMIPGAIFVAWICAILTILGAFSDIRIARISSAVGTCCAIWAAIHVSIMNSDVHSWLAASMDPAAGDSKDNPFAAMAANLGNLVANAFQLKAGWGLYALALFLALCGFLAYSRMLYSPSSDASNHHTEPTP
jgi:hypothetical protein